WVSVGIVLAMQKPRRAAPLLAALGFVAAIAVYGLVRMPQIEQAMRDAPSLRVALVQGNISVERKTDASYFDVNVDTYRALTAKVQSDVDLVIWPETVAQWWTRADAESVDPKHHPFAALQRPLVYGGPSFRYLENGKPETFNSAFLLVPGGKLLNRYDKQIL